MQVIRFGFPEGWPSRKLLDDRRTAVVADRLGMDILCVSDTGGMILFGHQSTVSASFDEVMMMAKAIDRGFKYGLRWSRGVLACCDALNEALPTTKNRNGALE
jgi:Ketopantoate hydroxymethyltransferase